MRSASNAAICRQNTMNHPKNSMPSSSSRLVIEVMSYRQTTTATVPTTTISSETTYMALENRGASHGNASSSTAVMPGRLKANALWAIGCGVWRKLPMPMKQQPHAASSTDSMAMRTRNHGMSLPGRSNRRRCHSSRCRYVVTSSDTEK